MFNSGTRHKACTSQSITQNLGRIWIFVLIVLGIFCTQLIFFLLNSLDEKLTEEAKEYQNSSTAGKCNSLDDPLAISALARMRTAECKWMLKHRLCSMEDIPQGYWPVEEIQNNCHQYFNKSRQSTRLGCFRDSTADRLLKQHRFTFPTTNSPELCIQNCLRAGFHLAGVEYGKECFCGSTLSKEDFNAKLVEDTMCEQYKCPGNDFAFCGGFEAVQVYRTGVQGKHNQKLHEFRSIDGDELDHGKIKILFLFQLNGRNSRQIRRLLRMIYNPKHLYLVHVDSRQHYMFSEMLAIERDFVAKNIYNFRVFQYRLATIWGGTSLLELFLLTIAETTKGPDKGWRQWDYLLNLSELDMPLLSLEELEHNLASATGMSFLSSHGYNTGSFLHKQGFNFHFMECEQRMWRIGTRTGFPRNLRLDGGSDWVVVHRELAEFAISTDELPSQLRLIFTTILLPLESFFHTLALNSGQFCDKIFYRNLRFTNWRRKQGCRCAALKPVVDWCGCSPLALRGFEAPKKLEAFVYFAPFLLLNLHCTVEAKRRVNSLDESSIHLLTWIQLHLLNSNVFSASDRSKFPLGSDLHSIQVRAEFAAFNSTWVNIYSATAEDSNSSLAAIGRQILIRNGQFNPDCKFHRIHGIHLFKASAAARAQSLFSMEAECLSQDRFQTIEVLFDKLAQTDKMAAAKNIFETANGTFQFDTTQGIEFGLGFDVKEEIFRVQPPLLDLSNLFTLKWHWNLLEMPETVLNKNLTSPTVDLELEGPNDELLLTERVGPYDSVNGNQFAHINLGKIRKIDPGTWKVTLFLLPEGHVTGGQRIEIAKATFPVFPLLNGSNSNADDLTGQLLSRHFNIKGICALMSNAANENGLKDCYATPWSSFFPDEKAMFP